MNNFTLEEIKKQFDDITKMKIFEMEIVHTQTKEKDYVIFNLEYNDTHLIATSNNDDIKDCSVEWDTNFDIDAHLGYLSEECSNAIMNSVWEEPNE